jgi:TolB-like protein
LKRKRAERRISAILAADIVGYSRLMGADDEGTLSQLKIHHNTLVEPKIKEYRGYIVRTTGDGLLVLFASVVEALRCAIEIQRGMVKRNARVPPEKRIAFRMGINVGDVIIDGVSVHGDGVNVAARLEALADIGGICVSRRVQEDAHGTIDIAFEDTGEQQLKNIARLVHVYRVRLEGTAVPEPALPNKPSIAVLPFTNMSGDSDQDYFADGIVEDITTALSRVRALFVIARNSSFTYKGRAVDVIRVGHELGVRYVLEGSVRKAGAQVRVSGQLIDASTGAHLWADRFDGALDDIFALQDRITMNCCGSDPAHARTGRDQASPTEADWQPQCLRFLSARDGECSSVDQRRHQRGAWPVLRSDQARPRVWLVLRHCGMVLLAAQIGWLDGRSRSRERRGHTARSAGSAVWAR